MKITVGDGITFVEFAPSVTPNVAAPLLPAASAGASLQQSATQWSGHYRVETNGKSDDEIVAEVGRIQAHHAAKSDKLSALAAHCATPLVVGSQTFTWGVTIRERGADVEIVICGVDAVTGKSPKCLPMEIRYQNVAAIPDEATIRAIATSAIAGEQQAASDAAAKIARLTARLAGEP